MKIYEFEKIEIEIGSWNPFFGGVGLESVAHREVICRRAADGWRYVGFIPLEQRAEGFIESIDLVFEKDE